MKAVGRGSGASSKRRSGVREVLRNLGSLEGGPLTLVSRAEKRRRSLRPRAGKVALANVSLLLGSVAFVAGSHLLPAAATTPPSVTVSNVAATVYPNPNNSGSFDTSQLSSPAFTQSFSVIDFNPPSSAQVVCSNSTGVDENTRPLTDVIPNPDGTCSTQVAAGNGVEAGTGGLNTFEAVFQTNLTVDSAAQVTFNFFSDDGWILGLGKQQGRTAQPTYVSGELSNPPPMSPIQGYPVVGALNGPSAPTQAQVTVNFPAAGTYPMEVDYTECCGGQLALTLGTTAGNPIPPTSSWTPLGPKFVTDTRGQDYVESGRVTGLAPDPASNSIYVGTVGGGVWRVDTTHYTWTSLSDSAPSLSIGALALAHPTIGGSVLLAGTGEQAEPRSYGIGIMRGVVATGGSVSWSVVASLPGASVHQIVVDPNNPGRVLAATSSGLFISTDAGLTWSRRVAGNFTAVAPDPSAPGNFLAADTAGGEPTPCSAQIFQGPFFAAGPPLISYQFTGLSPGPFAADVALTSSTSQTFALAADCSGKYLASLAYVPAGGSGTYHWQAFATSAFVGNGSANGLFGDPHAAVDQGTFDNVITAVPGASCDVIVGGVGLDRITTAVGPGGCNGKPTVTTLNQTMHEDMHALAISGGTLYVGNDGGLWSTPSLSAPLWTTWHGALSSDQSISTFYEGEALDSSHLIGGLQDDGTVSTLASGSTNRWSEASSGGDGGYSYAWAGGPKYFQQTLDTWDYTNRSAGPIGACYTINIGVFPYQCSNGDNTQIPDPPLLVDTLGERSKQDTGGHEPGLPQHLRGWLPGQWVDMQLMPRQSCFDRVGRLHRRNGLHLWG